MIVSQWSRMRRRTVNEPWWVVGMILLAAMPEVMTLSGPNICIVQQKYNITKRVKYRAPMSIRTYEWCLAVPPRCSRYTTEMRDLTRLENEERTAEIAVCCPGYKLRGDFTCAPICPLGKTGAGCSSDCPPNKWGPNCVHDCTNCTDNGKCSPITGECICIAGWRGERCDTSMPMTASTTTTRTSLLTTPIAVLTTSPTETSLLPTTPVHLQTTVNSTRETTNQVEHSSEQSYVKVTNVRMTEDLKTTKIEDSNVKGTNPTDHIDVQPQSQSPTHTSKTDNEDYVTNKVNKTRPVLEITEKMDDFTEKTVYNNSTMTPWLTAATVVTFKNVFNTTYSATSFYTTESTTSPKKEIPQKILPLTKTEITTKSTPATLREIKTTKKPEPTKVIPATAKIKPKEIWIKPAQKGEIQITESKHKSHESPLPNGKYSTLQDLPATTTTPRTIIVSIIPTSMSYPTFKKIALSTASAPHHTQRYKTSRTTAPHRETKLNQNTETTTPFSIAPNMEENIKIIEVPKNSSPSPHGSETSPMLTKTTKYLYSEATNSMSMTNEVSKQKYHLSIPAITTTQKGITVTFSEKTLPLSPLSTNSSMIIEVTSTPMPKFKDNNDTDIADKAKNKIVNNTSHKQINSKTVLSNEKANSRTEAQVNYLTTSNVAEDSSTNTATNSKTQQDEEETFHILTEPEHITAVAGDRPSKISTVDLIYVLTIVGGMVMAIITIAVVIVMFERCKRHRYSDMMKVNNIGMQVVIDNNESPPPPYVRSIFHTPLPDPPMSEKCHYQPISTLDRNLKQFMRPVVVQAISPLMLENFRGILECHYDHLPRRSHDFKASGCGRMCCSVAPSMDDGLEPHGSRINSLTESTIEALKCKADVDEIEASEPLYAEIPCWRPPSAHAVEVLNLNGEASTEL